MSLWENESCSLEACVDYVHDLLGLLHVNRSSLFEYEELYVTGATEFHR